MRGLLLNMLLMKLDFGLLVLRLGVGGLMLFAHGWDKLVHFQSVKAHFPDPIGLGSTVALSLVVFAEFFCALAVCLGLLTRYVVVPLIITMAVAAFIIHADDPFAKKEFALLYLIPFLSLFFTGPGKYSLDSYMRGK